jgi:hypothetical protein
LHHKAMDILRGQQSGTVMGAVEALDDLTLEGAERDRLVAEILEPNRPPSLSGAPDLRCAIPIRAAIVRER